MNNLKYEFVLNIFISLYVIPGFSIFFNFAKNAAQNEYNQLFSSMLNICFGSYSDVLTIGPSRGYRDGV